MGYTVIIKGMARTTPPEPPADADQLPPGLDVLWRRRDRGQRGPKPGLTVEAIVEAAIGLADEGGFEAVSMAKVAKRLGFTPMSLYRYVKGKDELLALMWNGSAQGAESLQLTGEGWRARLRQWAVIQRDMLDRHPWLTQMPMAAPPMAPNSLAFVERGLGALDDAELSDRDRLRVIGLISSYTLSEARMADDARRATRASGAERPADFGELLRLLVDEATYPRLHRIAWSGQSGGSDERQAFLEGLDIILDGVQAAIDRNASQR